MTQKQKISPIGSDLQDAFDAALDEIREMPDVDFDRKAEAIKARIIQTARPLFVETILGHMGADFREQEKVRVDFEARNTERWQRGWIIMSVFVRLLDDLVQDCLLEVRRTPESATVSHEVIVLLATRAARIGRECITLLRAGYPDGALGRWRTLYETAVIVDFISTYGDEVAERYLARQDVSNYSAAKLFRERVSDGDNDFPASDLQQLQKRSDAAKARFGEDVESDWGWSRPAFLHKRIDFAQIEERVGMSHWRPYYKRASRDVHAPHQDPRGLLGMSEAQQTYLLAGPSNSGMIGPSSLVAHSLKVVFSAVVRKCPNVDRLTLAEALEDLHPHLAEIFETLEAKTLRGWQLSVRSPSGWKPDGD